MNLDLLGILGANLLSPAVLFFVLGCVATLVRSDLKFPEPLYTALTIYLLTAIGFKGGAAIADAGIGRVWLPAAAALLLGTLIPLWAYPILRWAGRLRPVDAAAIAAHYGSVSAVTYIAATNFLRQSGIAFEEYCAAFLAVMESPAIVVGVLLGRILASHETGTADLRSALRQSLHDALAGRSVLLLVGAMLIGYLSGKRGMEATSAFFVAPFQGILALFLLEMGMVAARRFGDLRQAGSFLLVFATAFPVANGFIGAAIGWGIGLSVGGTTLFAVLAASASYIAAPAAMRLALPEANPTLYLTSSLAVTFPFNLTLGLPLYALMARWWHGTP
ncbi:MAG: sodium-dependent bicarbonate transport family permease [Verrucomicrobiales bacterium]|nr:sodium-dependent bicarbonate transport family permease [Verrucomicrobiales bacterium]